MMVLRLQVIKGIDSLSFSCIHTITVLKMDVIYHCRKWDGLIPPNPIRENKDIDWSDDDDEFLLTLMSYNPPVHKLKFLYKDIDLVCDSWVDSSNKDKRECCAWLHSNDTVLIHIPEWHHRELQATAPCWSFDSSIILTAWPWHSYSHICKLLYVQCMKVSFCYNLIAFTGRHETKNMNQNANFLFTLQLYQNLENWEKEFLRAEILNIMINSSLL